MRAALFILCALLGSLAHAAIQQQHIALLARKNVAGGPTYATIERVGAAGLGGASTNDPSVAYPTVQAGDIVVVAITTFATRNLDGTPPTGWVKWGEVDTSDNTGSTAYFWKRAAGALTTPETWTDLWTTGSGYMSVAIAYRNCIATGDPLDSSDTDASATNVARTIGPLTPTTDGCMLVGIMGCEPDSATAETNTWGGSVVEWIDQDTTPSGANGTTAAIYIGDLLQTDAAEATFTATLTGDEATANVLLALKPAPL